MICVTDTANALEMCYPVADAMQIAARMVDAAVSCVLAVSHGRRAQEPAKDAPPPMRLFVPR